MEKALVTGVAGFIGSNLAEKLLEQNVKVIGIDSFTPYYSRAIKEKNLASIKKNQNFTFVEADLLNYDLQKLLNDVDTIFHEAAQPGVRFSWDNFEVYVQNNILATQKLLEACKQYKTKFIFASSSSVYGNAPLPINENAALSPISPYGVTKLTCEKLCKLYHDQFGVQSVVLRYFTVYGERQRPDMAIYKFVENIFSGKEIEIYGDGKQTRDMTYVSDIVEGTISAAAFENLDFQVYNLGSGVRVPLNNIISHLENFTGKKAKVVNVEAQKGDVKDTWADIGKARAYLEYDPKVHIEEGLKNFVEWFKKK